MRNRLIPALAALGVTALLAGAPAFAAPTGAYAGQKLVKLAHISIDKAQAIALKGPVKSKAAL